jgi:MFS family permease
VSTAYRGWRIVIAAAIGQAISPGPVAFYSIGVLMQPLSQIHGWDRAQLSLLATILTVSIFATMPFVGAAIDRYGAKQVLLPSLVAFGLALAGTGLATTLGGLYTMYAIMGVVCAGTNSVPYVRTVSVWFDRRRGLAIGIASAGMGAGFTLVPAYTQFLLNHGSAHTAYIGLSALVLLIGLPVVGVLLQNEPLPQERQAAEYPVRTAESDGALHAGATIAEAARMPQFWAILLIFAAVGGAVYGVALHLVSIVRAIDPVHDHAILAATLFGAMGIVGRLCAGPLYDRVFPSFVASGIFLTGTLGIVLLAGGAAGHWPLLAALLVGLCSSAEGDALAVLCSRYFGLRAYGKIYGYAFAATLVGIAAVPYVIGLGYEHYRGYTMTLYAAAALLGTSAILTLFLGAFPVYDPTGRRIRTAIAAGTPQMERN